MCQFRGDDSAFLPDMPSTGMLEFTVINYGSTASQEIINENINGYKDHSASYLPVRIA
jgi:hypothetical protein